MIYFFLTVFPHMVKKLNTGLHVMIIMFLCVAIFFSLVSFGFCILNAIKVPYRAINGPAGACLWNFLAGKVIFQCFSLVTFIENYTSSFFCLTEYLFDLNIVNTMKLAVNSYLSKRTFRWYLGLLCLVNILQEL